HTTSCRDWSSDVCSSELWSVAVSTRTARAPGEPLALPDGARAPADVGLREELVGDPERYREAIERDLAAEAFELRLNEIDRRLRDRKSVVQGTGRCEGGA